MRSVVICDAWAKLRKSGRASSSSAIEHEIMAARIASSYSSCEPANLQGGAHADRLA